MNTFTIPVSSIGETGYTIDACAPVIDIQPAGTRELPIHDVTVDGCFTAVDNSFMFRGTIRGSFLNPCYRCLNPARVEIAVAVTWVFRQGEAHAYKEINHEVVPEEVVSSEGNRGNKPGRMVQEDEIDLGPYIWEELVFAQPSRFICKEDCKGMCPGCGANLNTGVCTCADASPIEPERNAGLASLAHLFPELVPENKKE